MPRVSIGEIPFKLSFGIEAVILINIRLPSYRIGSYDEWENSDRLHSELDFADEVQEKARVKMDPYQQKVIQYYNS